MFQVNDVIIYGAQGVCIIAGIEEKNDNGVPKSYFILKPVNDKGATIFAPTDNELVRRKMRRLLTKDEIHKLIDSMPEESPVWVVNENERKELYKNILTKGDHIELIKMLKAIYAHKQECEAAGKHLHMSDDRFFKDAEKILYNEFQYVLNLQGRNDLMAYILERIETQKQQKGGG